MIVLSIEQRVDELEKANRRWRHATALLGCVLLICLTGAAVTPEKVPDLLQAKRIEVLRPDGKPVIVLKTDAQGSALTLVGGGHDHERTVAIGADEKGVRLMLMKHKEAPLLTAEVNDVGSSLALFDGREPSQEPGGIILRSETSSDQGRGATGITLTRGWRKDGLLAGLLVEEPPGLPFLFLGGQQGRTVRVNVNQQNGKVECIGDPPALHPAER